MIRPFDQANAASPTSGHPRSMERQRLRSAVEAFHANDHVLHLQTPPMMKENNGAARGCQRSIFFLGALTPHANVTQAHHSYPILSPLSTHGKQATYRQRCVGFLMRLATK